MAPDSLYVKGVVLLRRKRKDEGMQKCHQRYNVTTFEERGRILSGFYEVLLSV